MSCPKRSASVHVEQVGEELCVYNLDGHRVHALNRAAALVWERCDGTTTPDQIAIALGAVLDVPNARGVVDLALEQLDRAQLLAAPLVPRPGGPDVGRRRLLKGGLTAAAIPAVWSIMAPYPAAAQSFCIGLPTVTGILGKGSPNWPSVSGTQNARLFRDGVASSCIASKSCSVFESGSFPFDAYTFHNNCGATVCVTCVLLVLSQSANYQCNAYLGSFDPTNICTNYLADPGLSSGSPPSPTAYSFNVPNGSAFVIEVHSVTAGSSGDPYQLLLLEVSSPMHNEAPTPSQVDTDVKGGGVGRDVH